jgi:anhydro-N-acetylmuramic acid kinase
MMEDAYFSAPYPKSTGREKFNPAWLERVQQLVFGDRERPEAVDVQRTLLELTALSISNEVLKFNPDMLLLCGGGVKNSFLVERIAALMPNVQVGIMEQADWLEAMMMAWLAYKRIHEEPVDLKDVTGAKANTVLGAIFQ